MAKTGVTAYTLFLMIKQNLLVYYFILFSTVVFSQNESIILSGTVTDSINNYVNNVTIIAKPKLENIKTSYAISKSNGDYKLKKGIIYQLSISHLIYNSIKKEVRFVKNNSKYDIKLVKKNETLNEVVINYKYQAIKKNKDTITYNLGAFTNGNEFKMKEVLNKLPGIKIEENIIKVHGKTVTKLLVEGKSFFDGSTKLAINNIPADVMAKIEIISDYKETELLRNLADNEDLALNVVLKEDKKDFAFGDIAASVGLDKFYSLHTALFKYNPKSNISFIGDINNFNNSSLSFSDLSRLVGGSSNLFKKNNLSNNLLNFASNTEGRYASTTRFSALNIQHEFDNKFNIAGYAIYSNNDILFKSATIREYLGNQPVFETRSDLKNNDDNAAIFNLKLDYNPNTSQKWIYNVNYLNNASYYTKESVSNSENTNQFFTNSGGKSDNFTHNLEGYFKLNDKHTIGLALNHSITNSNALNKWDSNSVFLEDYLPLNEVTSYQIKQISDINAQKFNFLFKDY